MASARGVGEDSTHSLPHAALASSGVAKHAPVGPVGQENGLSGGQHEANGAMPELIDGRKCPQVVIAPLATSALHESMGAALTVCLRQAGIVTPQQFSAPHAASCCVLQVFKHADAGQ